jgi:hypothetical protein
MTPTQRTRAYPLRSPRSGALWTAMLLCGLWAAFLARPARGLDLDDSASEECTIAVLGAGAAVDGRPMLWKNRDSGFLNNEVVYFTDGLYPYVALVSAGELDKAWLGVNDQGFALMNALSYNIPDQYGGGITNGALMKLALRTCADVEDFENLLKETNVTGRQNPANLGAIDASGHAAMFEAGNFFYVRYDADDPAAAPKGYLVRANFSFCADTAGSETWRFRRGKVLLSQAADPQGVKPQSLIRISRDLCAPGLNPYPLPYNGSPPGYPQATGCVNTEDTINRRSTVSGGVICGVNAGEDPRLATFYVALGQPVVTPFIPVWAAAGPTPPELDGPVTAPICDLAQSLARACYDQPYQANLLNTRTLVGVFQGARANLPLVEHIEGWLLDQTMQQVRQWRLGGVTPSAMAKVEADLAAAAFREYSGAGSSSGARLAGLTCSPNPTRGLTAISFRAALALPAAVDVEIFDASGRRRVSLPGGDAGSPAGQPQRPGTVRSEAVESAPQRVVWWDGLDEGGTPVPSGVYFCRPTWPPDAGGTPLIVVR